MLRFIRRREDVWQALLIALIWLVATLIFSFVFVPLYEEQYNFFFYYLASGLYACVAVAYGSFPRTKSAAGFGYGIISIVMLFAVVGTFWTAITPARPFSEWDELDGGQRFLLTFWIMFLFSVLPGAAGFTIGRALKTLTRYIKGKRRL